MEKENTELKWWQSLLVITLLGSIVWLIISMLTVIVNGYSERVYLRELTIIKTRHEIIRLKCGDRGGSFDPNTYLTLCN